MSTRHIRKPQHADRFEVWCGRPVEGFTLVSIDHAASCLITETYVQPCKHCIREAVAVLTGAKKYRPAKVQAPHRTSDEAVAVLTGADDGDLKIEWVTDDGDLKIEWVTDGPPPKLGARIRFHRSADGKWVPKEIEE